jgi:hypothetical protein
MNKERLRRPVPLYGPPGLAEFGFGLELLLQTKDQLGFAS